MSTVETETTEDVIIRGVNITKCIAEIADVGYIVVPDFVNPEEIAQRLELLRSEHRDLDSAIIALGEAAVADQLQLARLKKRKLKLRDEIAWYEDQLLPDIIA